MLYANSVATLYWALLWILTYAVLWYIPNAWLMNPANLLFIVVPAVAMAWVAVAFVFLLITPLTLLYGLLFHKGMQKLGYTTWTDYVLGGLLAGVLMAILSQGIVVQPYIEVSDSNYLEVFGWDRSKLYIAHFIRGGATGIIFAVCYWTVANRKPLLGYVKKAASSKA